MNKNTLTAIQKRLDTGATSFFIGKYFYETFGSGAIRRCEQRPDHTPTSDWERVCAYNPVTWKIIDDDKSR